MKYWIILIGIVGDILLWMFCPTVCAISCLIILIVGLFIWRINVNAENWKKAHGGTTEPAYDNWPCD